MIASRRKRFSIYPESTPNSPSQILVVSEKRETASVCFLHPPDVARDACDGSWPHGSCLGTERTACFLTLSKLIDQSVARHTFETGLTLFGLTPSAEYCHLDVSCPSRVFLVRRQPICHLAAPTHPRLNKRPVAQSQDSEGVVAGRAISREGSINFGCGRKLKS